MSQPLTRARTLFILSLVLLLAFALRAGRWAEERQGPLGRVPLGDEGSYDAWAQRLATGEAPPRVPYMAPLPAYVLGGLHRLLSPPRARDAFRLLGVLLGVGTVALTFLCGRELAGPRLGLVAAFLTASHRPLIYYEPTLLRDGPATFLTALAALLLIRVVRSRGKRQAGLAFALGLTLGVGALVRENLLVTGGLVALGAAAVVLRRRGVGRGVVAGLVIGAGLFLPSTPWLLQNHRLEGAFSPFPTWNGGCVFYIHNRVGNLSAGYQAPAFLRAANPEGEQEGFRRVAERRTGRNLTPHEVGGFWLRQGLQDVARAPGLYGLKVAGRARALLCSQEAVQARDLRLDQGDSRVLSLPFPGFGFLVTLAMVGLLASWGRPEARAVTLLVAALVASSLLVAFATRYRLPAVPLVSVLAALGAREVARSLRRLVRLSSNRWSPDRAALAVALSQRQASAGWVAAGSLALAAGLGLHLWDLGYRDTQGRRDRAGAYMILGEYPTAIGALAATRNPTVATYELLEELGRRCLDSGLEQEAMRAYQCVLAWEPRRGRAWAGLALTHLALGDHRAAHQAIQRAIASDPNRPGYRRLERLLAQRKNG